MQLINMKRPAFPSIGFSTKWLTRKVIYIWETILNVWRKSKTIREMTLAMRGNAKPFGKWLSPGAETSNLLGNELREARKSFYFPQIDESNNNSKPLMEHIP